MKCSIIAMAMLITFSFTTENVLASPAQQEGLPGIVADDRKEIKYEELPENIRTTFEESQFSHWEVSKVHEIDEENIMVYELTISDGTQTGILTFDEDGNMI